MTLADRLRDTPYQGYAYSYPHKMAYQRFEQPLDLAELWAGEDRSALFLYLHLPFCEMRCGFCNLFTTTNPKDNLVGQYLQALDDQMRHVSDFLSGSRFARAAFGGGTPSFLTETELEQLFASLHQHFGDSLPAGMPASFEFSPGTPAKALLLREAGITRASIGVQSFIESETRALGRPQKPETLHEALRILKAAEFPVLNLDLIYGVTDQTPTSWQRSLELALEYDPEEIYLYPLYVRPLTGLERIGREPSDDRLALYRQGRDLLLSRGYRQISMRLFRRMTSPDESANLEGPLYCCQEDGMVGLGAGARSYTHSVHYSTEYAVGRNGIDSIIQDFLHRDHGRADYGCQLTADDRQRRFLMKSLLRIQGLSLADYSEAFPGQEPFVDYPQLQELLDCHLATMEDGVLRLTPDGMERSDTIGPWLYAPAVQERMSTFELV